MIAVARLASLGERLRSTVRPRSIRTRLVALLLTLTLAPLILSGFLAGHYGRTSLQESIGSNLQKVARAVVSSVDQGIEQRRRNVQALAAFPLVRESSAAGSKALVAARREGIEEAERAYASLSWEAHPVARHPLSGLLAELLGSSFDMTQIFLTDRDGWVVASSARTEDFYQADETWWFRAVSGGCGRSYIDDLHHDTSVGDQVTTISVPVCVDGEVAGVLKGKVALNRILHMVSDLDLEGSARVWIIKNNGEAVAAVEGSRLARVETGDARPAVNVARRIVGSVSGFLEAPMAEAESVIGYASSTGSGEFQGLGWIVLVVEPVAGAYAPIARFHATIAVVSVLMFLLVLALGIRAAARMANPIRRSTAAALAIAQGDLNQRIVGTGPAELDQLADRFNGMTENLRRMVGSIRQAAGEVESVSQLVADGSGVVLGGTRDQITQVEETTKLMNEADLSLEDVSGSLSQMVSATDDCSSSILEMEASITEIVRSTEALAGDTDSTLAAVEEMVQSITQVDRGIESLRSLAVATDSSVSGMEGVVQRVESMAGRTASATDSAAAAAEAGRVAVERTVAGMGGIEQSANQAAKVIRNLTEDVGKIGGIMEIIQEVTDQTNLLALNASILAAQAGDHGRGFAVVATEIKELAERTARSTNEITDLIRSIQDGASEAGEAMADGIRHINDGVARSLEAGEALQKIQGGTRESSEMTREIVGAATEHAAQSRQMTAAVKRINETVTRLAATTQEQARGCTSILQASEQMRDLTSLVRKAILDQKQGSRRISGSVEQINVMARAIDDSGQRQKGLSKSVVSAMGKIGSLSHANVASLAEMDNAVRTLTQRAEELRGQISRFRGGS